jgi:hypothetical protein
VRQSPIGGVSSSERVPRVRRRGEAAPLGRAWLEWGSCLETRASGAPAMPPDPKVEDRTSACLAGSRILVAWLAKNPATFGQHFPEIRWDSARSQGTVLLSVVWWS